MAEQQIPVTRQIPVTHQNPMNRQMEERRTAIIHAVWQVIAAGGMGSVTMRTVAAAADVSVGRIQYWFRSKDELLRASLAEMLANAAQLHEAQTADVEDHEALWLLISHPIPRARSARAGVSVFHQYVAAGINHPVLAGMLAEAKDGEERQAAQLLQRIVPDLADPRTAARSLVATADGLTMRVLIRSLSVRAAEDALRTAVDRITS